MLIENSVNAKNLNTFDIDIELDHLITVTAKSDLYYIDFNNHSYKILGGGSNVLLTSHLAIPIINIDTKGKEIISETDDEILIEVAAGENWHDLVLWAVENGYGGIENLSLIPGKCGAAPMQNIGAYGIEIKDVLHAVKVFDIKNACELIFHNQECKFAYRTSNFKTIWKDKFIITEIVLRLTKINHHKINISYGAIADTLREKNINDPSIQDISKTVIEIRQAKLPDPNVIGNAGSFFKNPVISILEFETLKAKFPDVPSYPSGNDIKIPAAWLIDQCGWKGKVVGETGTYKNQALVIVNHGKASGEEILNFSKAIQKSVFEKFRVQLSPEVNVW